MPIDVAAQCAAVTPGTRVHGVYPGSVDTPVYGYGEQSTEISGRPRQRHELPLFLNETALGRFDVDDAEAFMIDVVTRGDLDLDYIAIKLKQYSSSPLT